MVAGAVGGAVAEVAEPVMSLDDWRKLVAGWKPRMGVEVNVGELTALIDRVEAAEDALERIEQWTRDEPECSDRLRRFLYPPKSSAPPARKSEGPAATIAGSPRKPGTKI